MEALKQRAYVVAAALAVSAAGGGYYAYVSRPPTAQRAEARIAGWPAGPRTAAELMMDRYGPPDALGPGLVVWRGRADWKRIAVRRDEPDAYLEQTVSYRAPRAAAAALRGFGLGVRADLADDELTAASRDESLNRLALNLAVEVADGRRGIGEAREFYAETVRFGASGRASPYLEGLLFRPYRPAAQDRRRRGIGYP